MVRIQSGNSLHNPRGFSGKENNTLVTQEHVQVSPFSFSGRIAIWSSRSVRKDGLQSTANTPILVGKTVLTLLAGPTLRVVSGVHRMKQKCNGRGQ